MWIEIVNEEGKPIGAVNSEACDLLRVGQDGPTGRALIRNPGESEVYATRVSYLRLIETLTQSEATGLKQIADIVGSVKEQDGPKLVLP